MTDPTETTPARKKPAEGALKARQFLFFAEDHAMTVLEPGLVRPQRKVMWTILQLHHGDETMHYEVQPHIGRRQVELGLHFEADSETNEQRAQLLAAQAPLLQAELGPEWELEEWTASWRRLHRVYRFSTLTTTLGRTVGDDLARLIAVTAPMIPEMEAVEPQMPRTAAKAGSPSRRFRGRAGARR
jgi:hypothetical protein